VTLSPARIRFRSIYPKIFASFALVALSLSSCGGSGGGVQPQPFGSDSNVVKNADSAVVAEAAGNAPQSGSVTQSSNGDGAEAAPTTTDVATATIGVDASTGELQWTVEVTDTEATTTISVSSESDDVLGRSSPPDSSYDGIELFKQEDGGGRLWVDVYTDFDPVETVTTATVMEPGPTVDVQVGQTVVYEGTSGPGTLDGVQGNFQCSNCVVQSQVRVIGGGTSDPVVTSITGSFRFTPSTSTSTATTYSDDSDYLAGGIWVYAPDDAAGTEDYEFGAFVDGSELFTPANLAALTGTAEYAGEATGVYTDATEDRNYFFDADVSLTANFDDADEEISGTISGFEVDGDPVEGDPMLMLETAGIEITNFFTGDTSMTFGGDEFAGKWGGRFYGNGADPADHPGSVGGTFGGATEDDSKAFLGVFGADKQ
jgi:hypothetical protein